MSFLADENMGICKSANVPPPMWIEPSQSIWLVCRINGPMVLQVAKSRDRGLDNLEHDKTFEIKEVVPVQWLKILTCNLKIMSSVIALGVRCLFPSLYFYSFIMLGSRASLII